LTVTKVNFVIFRHHCLLFYLHCEYYVNVVTPQTVFHRYKRFHLISHRFKALLRNILHNVVVNIAVLDYQGV